jgi:hypothetical protein
VVRRFVLGPVRDGPDSEPRPAPGLGAAGPSSPAPPPPPDRRLRAARPGAGAEAARVLGPWAFAAAPSSKCMTPRHLGCAVAAAVAAAGNSPSLLWHNLAARLQTGGELLLQVIFTIWPDPVVPIQTGAPAQIKAADRPSGTPAVLPGRYMASVDHTGLLRRPASCEVLCDHTARAHAATAVLSDCLRFCMCGLVLCGSSAG